LRLRDHQVEIRTRTIGIMNGEIKDKLTLVDVTPAGGKTGAGTIAADMMFDSDMINLIVWVVPTTTLCSQVEKDFIKFALLPRKKHRALRSIQGQNKRPFVRPVDDMDVIGYVTTYQAIAANPKIHLKEMKGKRVLLILDEAHHIFDLESEHKDEVDSWLAGIGPMQVAAKHTIMLSGTTERHDQREIAFLREAGLYEDRSDGRRYLKPHIRYAKAAALRNRAIIKVEFILLDGEASWSTDDDAEWPELARQTGEVQSVVLSEAKGAEARRALAISLVDKIEEREIEFGSRQFRVRRALLDMAVKHWRRHVTKPPRYVSGMLVVCATQNGAKQAVAELVRKHGLTRSEVALAISDEPGAEVEIERYKSRKAKILVSVAMIREGFDTQHTSHIALLTGVRSRPWLDQIVARAIRVDSAAKRVGISYADQVAHIFALKDTDMREYAEDYLEDQANGLAIADDEEHGGGGAKKQSYVPLSATEGTSQSILKGDEDLLAESDDDVGIPEPDSTTETPRELERRILREIAEAIRAAKRVLGRRPSETESDLKAVFGNKSRSNMSSDELKQVLSYLHANAKRAFAAQGKRRS